MTYHSENFRSTLGENPEETAASCSCGRFQFISPPPSGSGINISLNDNKACRKQVQNRSNVNPCGMYTPRSDSAVTLGCRRSIIYRVEGPEGVGTADYCPVRTAQWVDIRVVAPRHLPHERRNCAGVVAAHTPPRPSPGAADSLLPCGYRVPAEGVLPEWSPGYYRVLEHKV
jgi:hypothetical protein